MNNTHKRHRLQKFSVSERRVCFDEYANNSPEERLDAQTGKSPNAKPTEVLRSNEQQRPYWETIEYAIESAINKNGSAELKEIWKSKELREWIMAQVERNPIDGRFTFLPPNGRGHAEDFQRTAETRANGLVAINDKVSTAIDTYVATMDSAITAIRSASQSDTKKELPKDVDAQALIGYLNTMQDKETLKGRQHALVAIARDIAGGTTVKKLKKQLRSTLKDNKPKLGDKLYEKTLDALNAILDDTTIVHFEDKQKALQNTLITLGIIGFDTEDRKGIVTAINLLETAIADEGETKDSILIDVFERQTKYLRSLAGDDNSAVILNAVREDGAYSVDNFVKSVRVIKTEMTSAEETALRNEVDPSKAVVSQEKIEEAVKGLGFGSKLNAAKTASVTAALVGFLGGDIITKAKNWADSTLKIILTQGRTAAKANSQIVFDSIAKETGITPDRVCDALLTAWDTSKVEEYMKEDLGLNTEVGFSIKALMLRAKMPDDVAEFLINSKAKIRVSDLTKLSEIEVLINDGKEFTDVNKELILEEVVRESETMNLKPAEVQKEIDRRVKAYKQSGNSTDKAELVTYIEEGLRFNDTERQQALEIAKGPKDDIDIFVMQRLATQILTVAQGEELNDLTNKYKKNIAARADITAEKAALVKFLTEKLEGMDLILEQALGLVTDTFSDTEASGLSKLLTTPVRFIDKSKVTQLEDKLQEYKDAVTAGDQSVIATVETELINIMKTHLDGVELDDLKKKLDTNNKFNASAAESIYNILVETDTTGERLDKERFIETMTFLLVAEVSGSEVGDLDRATKRAEDLWSWLLSSNFVTGSGKVISKKGVLQRIQRFSVGIKSIAMHKEMHEEKLYELTWADNSKRYFSEFVDLAVEGGGSWLGYMANLSAFVYTTQDPLIAQSLKHRDRLNAIKKALEGALKASDESNKMIIDAIKQIDKLNAQTQRLSKPIDPTAEIGESVTQGLFLAEANAQVINILRAENLWDEIPNDVRQTSLWIAMNIGNGNQKIGLLEAKKFLRAYHAAPRAYRNYEDSFKTYMGEGVNAGQTDGNLDDYLASLVAYQEMTGIDAGLFEQYKTSISAYHNALTMTPAKIAGVNIKAIDSDGKSVEGVVQEIKNTVDLRKVVVVLKTATGNVEATFNFAEFVKVIQKNTTASHEAAASAYREAANAHESKKDPRDPASTAYNEFLQAYINGKVSGLVPLTSNEKTHLLRYRRKIEIVVEITGSSNLSAMFHGLGVFVRPGALMALSESRAKPEVAGTVLPEVSLTNGSYGVDHWLNEGHREFADEPLRIVLGGPTAAREALIKAYIQKKDVPYIGLDDTGKEVQKVVTAEEAFIYVSEVKRLIQWQSEQQHPALEELGEDELFKDPIEGAFRATIESLQDMWAGDGVDKAKVIAAVVAGVWLLRHIWREGGKEGASGFMKMAKYAIVGLPMLMVANSAYKNRTGRDILGEKLLYMSKPKRDGILEQWRRRSAKYSPERYGVLNHPAGFAGMQELMRKNDPVGIKDLHNWRMSVKDDGTGYNNYLNGMPGNINLSEIRSRLGGNASKEEAAKVAFMTYEALCVDVAAMHGQTSGDVLTRANWGADYIFREYHIAASYSDMSAGPGDAAPTLQDRIRGRNPGMLDVMIAEAQLPALTNSVKMEETMIERLASFLGQSTDWVKTKLVQGYTQLEILALKGKESIPDWWEGASDLVFETADEVAIWLRVRGIVGGKIIADNFWASLKAIEGVGITIMEVTPGVVKFVVDGSIDITASTLNKIKETHDYLLLHEGLVGEISLLKQFEECILSTVGYNFLQELEDKEAENQIQTKILNVASLYDGGNYSPIDGKQKYTVSRAYNGMRSPALNFGATVGTEFKNMTMDESLKEIQKHMNAIGKELYNEDDSTKLSPEKQRYILEIVQANLFKNIGNHPEVQARIDFFKKDIEQATKELDDAKTELSAQYPDAAQKNKEIGEISTKLQPLLTLEESAIKTKFEETRKKFEDSINRSDELKDSLTAIDNELKTASGFQKLKLNINRISTKSQYDSAIDKTADLFDLLKKLYVYKGIASRVTLASREDWNTYQSKTQRVPPIWETTSTYVFAKITTKKKGIQNLNMDGNTAISSRNDIARDIKLMLQRKSEIKDIDKNAKELTALIGGLSAQLNVIEEQGVRGVNIPKDQLFNGASGAEALAKNKTVRSNEILHQVYKENGRILGVPASFIRGKAGEIAANRIESWVNRRLSNDQTLLAAKKAGKLMKEILIYERYLYQIGLNEIFVRSMIQEDGHNEKVSPLHLSLDEAQDINKYLEETERLTSFARFLNIIEPLDDAKRNKYLP